MVILLPTVKNLVAMVTMVCKQPKLTVERGSPKNFDLKILVAMGLKLLRVGPLEWHYLHTKFH
jgi:hypothetical protein